MVLKMPAKNLKKIIKNNNFFKKIKNFKKLKILKN